MPEPASPEIQIKEPTVEEWSQRLSDATRSLTQIMRTVVRDGKLLSKAKMVDGTPVFERKTNCF